MQEKFLFFCSEGEWNCNLYVQSITLSIVIHLALNLPKCLCFSGLQLKLCFFISSFRFPCPNSPTPFQLTTHHHSLTISPVPSVPLSFSSPPTTIHSQFLLSHLTHYFSGHHPPPFTHHFSCPICPTVLQLTNQQHSLTISPVQFVPLFFSSPPTTIHSQFLLTHLSHSLSAHNQPQFTHHSSLPIFPTVFQLTTHHHSLTISPVPSVPLFQLTTHHHSLTISPVPSVPLSFSSPPTTIHSPVQTMQPRTVQFCPSPGTLSSENISPSAPVVAQYSHI